MIILDATTKSLAVSWGGTATTNEPTYVVSYYDTNGAILIEGNSLGTFTNATPITVCAAPAAGFRRVIKSVTIYNADTVSQTFTIGILVSSTLYSALPPTSVATLQSLVFGMDNLLNVNQGTNTTDSPTFANVTDSGLTASRLVLSDANKKLASNGALTTNYLPKAVSSGASLADSLIYDAATYIKIGTFTSPTYALLAIGNSSASSKSGWRFIESG